MLFLYFPWSNIHRKKQTTTNIILKLVYKYVTVGTSRPVTGGNNCFKFFTMYDSGAHSKRKKLKREGKSCTGRKMGKRWRRRVGVEEEMEGGNRLCSSANVEFQNLGVSEMRQLAGRWCWHCIFARQTGQIWMPKVATRDYLNVRVERKFDSHIGCSPIHWTANYIGRLWEIQALQNSP